MPTTKRKIVDFETIKGKKSEPTKPPHEYFVEHECYLPPENQLAHKIECGWLRNCILNLIAVNMGDVRAQKMYRSYAALCAEKHRQYNLYPLSIHPYSKLRVWSEMFFLISMLITNTLLAIHFSQRNPAENVILFQIIYIIDSTYLLNIIMNFFTGYTKGNTCQYVVLNLKDIIKKYATTWLILDILSTVYFIRGWKPNINDDIRYHLIMVSLKILRIPVLLVYLNNILAFTRAGILRKTFAQTFLLMTSYLTWNIYFQFITEYISERSFTPNNPRNCSWITIGEIWHESSHLRFLYALDRAVGTLRQTSNIKSLEKQYGCMENYFVIAWIISKALVCHCTLKYIIALFGTESAKAKYFIMTKQAETFMDKRNFPPRIKKKILKYYAIRFQSKFFAEAHMLSCITGQLREDIIMHTGRQLVNELEFLKQLPRTLLLQIGLKLKMVVFLAGDIIFKINTTGDCLYFIDKGTVAIYSESGNEICHLEDGDYFGEVALIMKQSIRTASAVAVTNCELFKLDKQDFDSTIAIYPTVYENIKKVAISRFERTCVLDEHHKTELKMEEEHKSKAFGDPDVESQSG